jgi:hypothetical protein
MAEIPVWAFAHIQKCRDAFGVGYEGFAFYSSRCKAPGGSQVNLGWGQGEPRYERGQVQIRRDLAPDAQGYEVLTHETLHAAMGAQGQAVARILDLVPRKQRKHALELWRDGNEATVTRLARGLTPVLCATNRKKGKTHG